MISRVDPAPVTLTTWTWGAGEPALVFLHALLPAATGRAVATSAAALTARLPVRVVGLDLPGFGGSPRSGVSTGSGWRQS